jgi:hypothetical protein
MTTMPNRYFVLATIIGAIAISSETAMAQVPPPSVKGSLVSATATGANGIVTLSYAVSAAKDATGAVTFVDIDISHGCSLTADNVTGAAIMSPSGWIGKVTIGRRIRWIARATASILPGQTLTGFSVRVSGLVGLCPFTVEPSINTTALGIPAPDLEGDLPAYEKKIEAAVGALSGAGMTLGPVQPPVDVKPADFLQTIIIYKGQALQLGWIKNKGLANSLDAKLNAAQQSLQRGNAGAARNELNALLNEVAAQDGKGLSSEAVALLKFNTQYLISKIP